MEKVQAVSFGTKILNIARLDEPRTVQHEGRATVFTHRVSCKVTPEIKAIAIQLASKTNESGKALSVGTVTDDGRLVFDIDDNRLRSYKRMSAAESLMDLMGASIEGRIIYRPKGAEYVNRATGETGTINTTHATLEIGNVAVSQEVRDALAYATMKMRAMQAAAVAEGSGFSFGGESASDVATGEMFDSPVDSAEPVADEAPTGKKNKAA
jgi:hypothetical protein